MNDDIYYKVAKVVSEQLNVKENISVDTTLDNLGADSLDQIEILMSIEETFNIEISDEEAVNLITINDYVNCVDKILNQQVSQ